MSRRLLAVATALFLALIGAALVLGYAGGADRRALATLDPVEVIVVGESPIPAGTPVEQLDTQVNADSVPARAAVPDHLTDPAQVEGLVTASALQPGEQLLIADFVDPASLELKSPTTVPEGMHEVTIPLDSPRALGGRIQAGETVGIVITSTDPDGGAYTHLTLHQVLVTRVQGGLAPPAPVEPTGTPTPAPDAEDEETAPAAAEEPTAEPAPQEIVYVSFALDTRDVEEVLFAAEHARIWLTRENESVPGVPTAPVTSESLWQSSGGEGAQE
jgi:pilus assembly protein CpaB